MVACLLRATFVLLFLNITIRNNSLHKGFHFFFFQAGKFVNNFA